MVHALFFGALAMASVSVAASTSEPATVPALHSNISTITGSEKSWNPVLAETSVDAQKLLHRDIEAPIRPSADSPSLQMLGLIVAPAVLVILVGLLRRPISSGSL